MTPDLIARWVHDEVARFNASSRRFRLAYRAGAKRPFVLSHRDVPVVVRSYPSLGALEADLPNVKQQVTR